MQINDLIERVTLNRMLVYKLFVLDMKLNRQDTEHVDCSLCCEIGLLQNSLVGWVLWHINLSRLFYAKSCFYIYFRCMICKCILLIPSVK